MRRWRSSGEPPARSAAPAEPGALPIEPSALPIEPSALPIEPGGDDGSAALEVVGAGVLLLVPLIGLVIALGAIQAGAFAVEAAASHAARVISTGADPATTELADRVVVMALADHGFDDVAVDVAVSCRPVAPCPARGGTVTVEVALAVPLPLVPALLGAAPPSVVVTASATRPVSRFAAVP